MREYLKQNDDFDGRPMHFRSNLTSGVRLCPGTIAGRPTLGQNFAPSYEYQLEIPGTVLNSP